MLSLCQFLLACFKVHMSKISDKTDKFLLNYSNLFWGPLFIRTLMHLQLQIDAILHVQCSYGALPISWSSRRSYSCPAVRVHIWSAGMQVFGLLHLLLAGRSRRGVICLEAFPVMHLMPLGLQDEALCKLSCLWRWPKALLRSEDIHT